jgi:hypothetical protein
MKKIIIFFVLFISLPLYSQKESDLGFSIGTSYYMGDINPTVPFYSPSENLGVTYRYNLNKRYVLKAEINYLKLQGNGADFTDLYQHSLHAFESNIYDLAAQFEFNFLPLKFTERKFSFSPFVSSGAAVAFVLNSTYSKSANVVFPAALGFRVAIGKKWSTGVHWNFRYMFKDNLDGVQNPINPSQRSVYFNNDWYSFAGIFLTYKVFDFGNECPAYATVKTR